MRRAGSTVALRSAIVGLDGDRAFDRVHDARELGENAVAGGVDDASGELADHRQHDGLVALEVAHRARLVGAHQRAIAGDVSRQDGAEPPFHALFGHFDRTCLPLAMWEFSALRVQGASVAVKISTQGGKPPFPRA